SLSRCPYPGSFADLFHSRKTHTINGLGCCRRNSSGSGGRSRSCEERDNVPDEQYIREEEIPEESIHRGVLIQPLPVDQFLAQVYSSLGDIRGKRRGGLLLTRGAPGCPKSCRAAYDSSTEPSEGGSQCQESCSPS